MFVFGFSLLVKQMSRLWKWMGYNKSPKRITPEPVNYDDSANIVERSDDQDENRNEDATLHQSVDKLFTDVPETVSFPCSLSQPACEEQVFKVVVIGNEKVGKTTFLKSIGLTTHESDAVYTVQFSTNRGRILLKLCDGLFTGKVDAAIYMYDITNSPTFYHLMSLRNHFASANRAYFEMSSLLIGNKCDLYLDRQVKKDELLLSGLRFLEVSAETGENVQLAFDTLIKMLMGDTTYILSDRLSTPIYTSPE